MNENNPMQPLHSEFLEKKCRVLAPVKEVCDVDAVLAYAGARATMHLTFLHVESVNEALAGAVSYGNAEALLGYAERRCRAIALAHESHILAGDLVFSILDAAELLACDAIVMARVQERRRWRHLFSANIVRQVERKSREVPLIVIDANGLVIRSQR